MAIRWTTWGAGAFSRARAEAKPVLLSLTATWCHGCHRMDRETWDAPGIDAVVERSTIPVRVDADARPDVYGRYHLGGLPTTAVLTPDGDFVRGATFLSPTGLLAFLESALADFSEGRRPGLRTRPVPVQPARLVDEMVDRLARRADLAHGGFGTAPKLPEVEALTLLLRHWRSSGEARAESIVRLSLDAIAEHLVDPVAGGFFRYAASQDWTGAHTEKLAVEQAALIRLFLEASPALGEPRYLEIARRALGHARLRLADAQGRVFASVAAAPDYYARPEAARSTEDEPEVDRRRFADAGAAMFSAGLLAWSVTGQEPGFASEFVTAAPSGMIPHRLDEPEGPAGLLRDQATSLRAAVDGYRLWGNLALLRWGERVAAWSLEQLWDDTVGAFRDAPQAPSGEPALPPIFPLLANGEMALALGELSDHASRPGFRDVAERVVRALAAEAVRSPAGGALALAAQRLEAKPPEADLSGDPDDPAARGLARVAVGALGPTTVVRWKPGKPATLSLCVSDLCLPPLGDPGDLLQSLVDLELAPGGILTVDPAPSV